MEICALKIFDLISSVDENQDEVCEMLRDENEKMSLKELQVMVNFQRPVSSGAETMLMWAVWRLKARVVEKLLEYGADPTFMNEMGNGVSTYWETNLVSKNQDVASEIAKMLHDADADLLCSRGFSMSIVQKAQEYGLTKLQEAIEKLDPLYASYRYSDLNDPDENN